MEDWKVFYTRAIDYLDDLDIDAEEADDWKTAWKQLKMKFTGEVWQTLKSLINNGTITLEGQRTPLQALNAIRTTIKAEDH